MPNKCVIFAAGSCFEPLPEINDGDLVIAADAGYKNCIAANVEPDIAVGDWDSLEAPPLGCQTVNLPVEKDVTDTFAAIQAGIERGYDEFHILGGTGGRIDHTVANLQSLVYLSKRGKRGYLYDENSVITAITDGRLEFSALDGGDVGVFAADGDAEGVTISGLKYIAEGVTLTADFPLGVSNSFVGRAAYISVDKGTLTVVFPKELMMR